MDTIANLVDKLITVNMKLWHLEDGKRNEEVLVDPDKLAQNVRATNYMNTERNNLMTEIDSQIADAIETGKRPKIHNNLKMY